MLFDMSREHRCHGSWAVLSKQSKRKRVKQQMSTFKTSPLSMERARHWIHSNPHLPWGASWIWLPMLLIYLIYSMAVWSHSQISCLPKFCVGWRKFYAWCCVQKIQVHSWGCLVNICQRPPALNVYIQTFRFCASRDDTMVPSLGNPQN